MLAGRAVYLAFVGDRDAIDHIKAAVEADRDLFAPGELPEKELPPVEKTLPVLQIVQLTFEHPDTDLGIQPTVVDRLIEDASETPSRTPFETILAEGAEPILLILPSAED